MRKLFTRICALFGRSRSCGSRELSSTQEWILRQNLRALLHSKEHLSDHNESAA